MTEKEICDYVVKEFRTALGELSYTGPFSIFTLGTYNPKDMKAFGPHSDVDFTVTARGEWLEGKRPLLEERCRACEAHANGTYGRKIKIWLDPLERYERPETFESATPSNRFENDGRRGLANLVTLHYIANTLGYLYGENHTVDGSKEAEWSGQTLFEALKEHPILKRADSYTLKKEGFELYMVSLRDLAKGIFKRPDGADLGVFRNNYVSKAILNAMYSAALTSGVGFLKPYDEITETGDMLIEDRDLYHQIVERAYEAKLGKAQFDFDDAETVERIRDFFNVVRLKNAKRAKEINYALDDAQRRKFENYVALTAPEIISDACRNFDERFTPLATLYVEDVLNYTDMSTVRASQRELVGLLEKFDTALETRDTNPTAENLLFRGRVKLQLSKLCAEDDGAGAAEYRSMAWDVLNSCKSGLPNNMGRYPRYGERELNYLVNRELGNLFLGEGDEDSAKALFMEALSTEPFDAKLWSYFRPESQPIIDFLSDDNMRDMRIFLLENNDCTKLFTGAWHDSLKIALEEEKELWSALKGKKLTKLKGYANDINESSYSYLYNATLCAITKNEVELINDLRSVQKNLMGQLEAGGKGFYEIFDDVRRFYMGRREYAQKRLMQLENTRRLSVDKGFRQKRNECTKKLREATAAHEPTTEAEKALLELGVLSEYSDKGSEEYKAQVKRMEEARKKYSEYLEKAV